MTLRTAERGNTITLAFVFYDDAGVVASVTSAEVQLTYPGRIDFETEKLTLSLEDGEWVAQWNSSAARGGWVEYHAHAYVLTYEYAQKGRFRLSANRASYDHDALPASGTASAAALGAERADGYE